MTCGDETHTEAIAALNAAAQTVNGTLDLEAIAKQTNLLQSITDNANIGVLTFGADGIITSVSPYHVRTFGRGSAEEYIGKINVLTNKNIVKAGLAEFFRRLIKTGQSFQLERYPYATVVTDRPVICTVYGIPLYDETGEITGGLILLQDVTEREQFLQRSIQMEQLRALGEMAAGIAHNFNNLMTIILGCSELIALSKNDPDTMQEESQVIIDTVQRATDIVSRIQAFTRFDGLVSVRESLDLNSIVEEAIAISQPKWRDIAEMTGRQIEIVTQLQPGIVVYGHAKELREVVTSLIFNAVDAMPDGGTLTITTRRVRDLMDKGTRDWVELMVGDTGVGMTEEVRQRCFDPFFTTKGPQLGRGLGLSATYGSVMRYGGEIAVESAPHQGTTFTIKLPIP